MVLPLVVLVVVLGTACCCSYHTKHAFNTLAPHHSLSLSRPCPAPINHAVLHATGLADVIEEILHQKCGQQHSAHVVSNHMIFEDDVLIGFSSPTYHVFNKKALYAKDISPFFKTEGLDTRHNLLLLGDSLGDTAMCEGLDIPENTKIKIGFLNDKVERLPDYLQAYDVVLLGDPDFHFVSSLLEDIVATSSPPAV